MQANNSYYYNINNILTCRHEREYNMRYRLLGNSGLRVSEIALGTMQFGEGYSLCADKHESRRIFETYIDSGGNFIDTANRYTDGLSEQYIGEFIGDRRDSIVLATKYTLCNRTGDPNASGNHRKNLVQSLEGSLRRLKTDYIDLFWVHAWDFMTSEVEVMRALDDMVRMGKVLYIGISDTPAWIVSRADAIAELRGWTRFAGLQVEYSLINRTAERDLLPMARSLDFAVMIWAPLGGGMLTGKYSRYSLPDEGRAIRRGHINDHNLDIAYEVINMAEEAGTTPSRAALSWIRQKPGIMIPIIGARTVEQLSDNLGCLDVTLDAEVIQALDDVSRIEPGFPHDFLSSDAIREHVYGGTYDRIINHRQ